MCDFCAVTNNPVSWEDDTPMDPCDNVVASAKSLWTANGNSVKSFHRYCTMWLVTFSDESTLLDWWLLFTVRGLLYVQYCWNIIAAGNLKESLSHLISNFINVLKIPLPFNKISHVITRLSAKSHLGLLFGRSQSHLFINIFMNTGNIWNHKRWNIYIENFNTLHNNC
jgi:hypothetical protein